jgi:hypothetical protein
MIMIMMMMIIIIIIIIIKLKLKFFLYSHEVFYLILTPALHGVKCLSLPPIRFTPPPPQGKEPSVPTVELAVFNYSRSRSVEGEKALLPLSGFKPAACVTLPVA